MRDFLLSYDKVCLRPRHSNLRSRELADTSLEFGGKVFNLPVVPANMEDVISPDNAKLLSESGHFYIYHRFGKENSDHPHLKTDSLVQKANEENWRCISVSIGTNGYEAELALTNGNKWRVDFVTIDVAHADHDNVEPAVKFVRKWLPDAKLIVGNVATKEGISFLAKLGVDAIKVGIGGGSICTTRYKTGFHLPTLQSVMEAVEALSEVDCEIPIIADGGAQHYGDVAKALVFGATMVMSGGWFASCIDSPARIINGKKIYRGSTSYESKGERRHIEGQKIELEEGFTYLERIEEIKQALQSSISYAGGNNLRAFDFVQWGIVS